MADDVIDGQFINSLGLGWTPAHTYALGRGPAQAGALKVAFQVADPSATGQPWNMALVLYPSGQLLLNTGQGLVNKDQFEQEIPGGWGGNDQARVYLLTEKAVTGAKFTVDVPAKPSSGLKTLAKVIAVASLVGLAWKFGHLVENWLDE